MRRSKAVDLVLVLSAAALADCGGDRARHCLDANNNQVDTRNCSTGGHAAAYHWYSGGTGGASAESTTTHGVIGAAGEAHGAGGGE